MHVGLWNGVGGKLENGECFETSMVRECMEESGVRTQKSDWKRAAKLTGIDWSVGVFAMRGSDNRESHPGYADMATFEPTKFKSDKPIYVPVAIVHLLDAAPYTTALIHLCLEKLRKPEMLPVFIQTYSH